MTDELSLIEEEIRREVLAMKRPDRTAAVAVDAGGDVVAFWNLGPRYDPLALADRNGLCGVWFPRPGGRHKRIGSVARQFTTEEAARLCFPVSDQGGSHATDDAPDPHP